MDAKYCPDDCLFLEVIDADKADCTCVNDDQDSNIIGLKFKNGSFLRHKKCNQSGETEPNAEKIKAFGNQAIKNFKEQFGVTIRIGKS